MQALPIRVELALIDDAEEHPPTSLELMQEREEQRCLRFLTMTRRRPFQAERVRRDI